MHTGNGIEISPKCTPDGTLSSHHSNSYRYSDFHIIFLFCKSSIYHLRIFCINPVSIVPFASPTTLFIWKFNFFHCVLLGLVVLGIPAKWRHKTGNPPILRMRIVTGLGVFYEHFCEKMASNSTLTSIYVSVYILYERIIVEGTNIPAHHLCN